MNADNLRGLRRVDGAERLTGAHPLAANDEFVLMAEHATHAFQLRLHGVLVCARFEVDERLVAEVAPGGKRKDHGGDFCGSHNRIVYGTPEGTGEVRADAPAACFSCQRCRSSPLDNLENRIDHSS